MLIKVCGITRLTDALYAVERGATALGFVFWPRSPRYITPERAAAIVAELPSALTTVGVFVNESVSGVRAAVATARINTVQLHGDERPAFADAIDWPLLRSVDLRDNPNGDDGWPVNTTLLVDASDPVRRGGTGVTVDWTRAADLARVRRVVLAGGLTPENVAEAIATVRPFGVDVSSGVEEAPGVKDFDKVARFVANAKDAFARL